MTYPTEANLIIKCTDLSIGYTTPLTIPFNFSMQDNTWLGIIGCNGSGKSTFLKTILGTLKPINGKISVLGHSPGIANKQISYIPQEREINLTKQMSGLSLIILSYRGWRYGFNYFNKDLKLKALELLDLVGASEYKHQAFNTLSGGQKKRIYLAQALINRPKLLLLDEPLADLDPNAKQQFISALQAIRTHTKLSLLIISHDMHEIANHLDGFIHINHNKLHYCNELPCIMKDTYVGI